MNGRTVVAALFCVSTVCTGPATAADSISLQQSGTGLWAQHASPKMRLSRVTASGSESQMKAEFHLANGTRRVFEGKLAGQGESSFWIRISRSGNADAHGSIFIQTATNDEIKTGYASGVLDGQTFLAQFTGQPPLRFNFLTEGIGTWLRQGSEDAKLAGIGLMGDMRMHTELVLFMADGSQRRFSGQVKKQIAKPRTLVVALKNFGEADAGGEVRVRLTEKKGILSVTGAGTVDAQPFKIDFQAMLEPVDRAAMFEARLDLFRKVSGSLTKGDASTLYSAWADDTGVRFVDAVIDQGEYGSSHRKMYFEAGKLIYFSEQGQVRNTASAAQGQMNLLELAISFGPNAKMETSSKMVNGKPVKLGAHDTSGAVNYADMLRKMAEDKLRGK